MAEPWKPVAAALADDARRLLWARVIVAADAGAPLVVAEATSRDRRAIAALERAGLVVVDAGAALPADPFSALLPHRPAASGIDRFLRDGRIAGWPKRPGDRMALLAWAAERAVAEGEAVDERTVTERLAAIADDPATLRRDLVDAGLLDRAADGSTYARSLRRT